MDLLQDIDDDIDGLVQERCNSSALGKFIEVYQVNFIILLKFVSFEAFVMNDYIHQVAHFLRWS